MRTGFLKRLSLAQRFMLVSLLTLLVGISGIGWWVSQEIADGVVHRSAATTALYVDSFLAPRLQEIAQQGTLSPERAAELDQLQQGTEFGRQIVALKVWSPQGRILYSTDPDLTNHTFPMSQQLALALQGTVTAEISNLDDAENIEERQRFPQLLEVYAPVRRSGADNVIAVAEFYQRVDDLASELDAAQERSWMVVGAAGVIMYLLLAGFVRNASNMITQQQVALNQQVTQLTQLLDQNQELHERVRRAAVRTTALNERFLRRISAELHDGPAQDLGLALLRFDHVIADYAAGHSGADNHQAGENLDVIQHSLRHALQEIRAISAGLGLPQLSTLTLTETLARVIHTHERRTGTSVQLDIDGLPEHAALPAKITLYRFVQEALNNAYRHGGGVAQTVRVRCHKHQLSVEVADGGPGFASQAITEGDQRLGLVGMRERVESLGGVFEIESTPGQGTSVRARFALEPGDTL